MDSSDESPGAEGLGLFKGHVELLPEGVKIPHMGWNKLEVVNDSPILEGIDGEYFYFVHSYHVVPDNEKIVAGKCDYGGDVVASLSQNNLFATKIENIISEVKTVVADVVDLKKKSAEYEKTIAELVEQNKAQDKALKDLEKRLAKLEKKVQKAEVSVSEE